MGIDPRRIRLEWVSASEGARFTQVVRELIEQVHALGLPRVAEWTSDSAFAHARLFGCATHALPGQMPMEIVIRGLDGSVRETVRRFC